jgi:ATP-binding cassette subfamily F protein uup
VEAVKPSRASTAEKKRRLTYLEAKELDALPERIDTLERDREGVYASLADPAVLRDGGAAAEAKARLAALDAEIGEAMERWEALATLAADA